MNRVLFVDEEPRVLEGLENLLFDHADRWDLHFVASGAEALARLGTCQFDAIVTEIRLRRMDGVTFLRGLQREHPGVARIVLSGHPETAALVRSLPIAHVFLSKPCTADVLVDTLERALSVHRLITCAALRAQLGQVSELPRRPRSFDDISRVMASPNPSIAGIAAVVCRDVSLAARVVQLANSALLSRGTRCARVDHAVSRLGVELVRAIVLGHELSLSMTKLGPLVEEVNARSLRVAAVAGRISDRDAADTARFAGVLHDVGRLLTAQLPVATGEDAPDHAVAGAYLLGLWGMDYPILDAVAHHHDPIHAIPAELDASLAVRVASAIIDGRRDHHDPRWSAWCLDAEADRESEAA